MFVGLAIKYQTQGEAGSKIGNLFSFQPLLVTLIAVFCTLRKGEYFDKRSCENTE